MRYAAQDLGIGAAYSKSDAAAAAFNVANTYVASDGDALATFNVALGSLAAASLVIPPPVGPIVAVVLGAGAKGVNVVAGYLGRSAANAARYLPIGATANVLAEMKSAWGTFGTEGAKDKICQTYRSNSAIKGLLILSGFTLGGLDCGNSGRIAGRVYAEAVSSGAPTWAAAMAAWKIAKDAGCPSKTLNAYAVAVGAVNATQLANPASVWAAKVEIYGLALTSAQIKETGGVPEASGGGGGVVVAIAAVVAALAFMG